MDYRYSFTDLFCKKVDLDKNTQVEVSSIVIPQIQRPYAQGRTDEACTYIRNSFLDEIFECLSSDNKEILELNFIYGIIKPDNDNYKLELLDGQQRLTTLFLLYWYIINAEFGTEQDESIFVRACLSKFFYETRASSTVFCQELSSYKVDWKGKTPGEVIRNAKWYFKSFDRDSTIDAMLTMLDSIHDRYIRLGRNNLFANLQNIQFYVKSLGVFNLSEELYIKMNARGLQLSAFENFKADLTNFVSNKDYKPFQEYVSLYNRDTADKVPYHFDFSVRLDAKWIDIFWKEEDGDFDNSYMAFFTRFFACKYIISSKDDVSDRDMRSDKSIKFFFTDAEDRSGNNEYFGFKNFEVLLNQHPDYIITLGKVLDVLYSYDCKSQERHIYKSMIPVWERKSEDCGDDFFCCSSKISQSELVALGAVIEYIEAMSDFAPITFNQWMRVVWNVIENTNIDSLTPVSSLIRKFSSVIHFVAERMREDKSFYTALSEWRMENSSERENRALLEEIEKAKRISEEQEWEEIWTDVEKHPYFKGMVTFFYKQGMDKEDYLNNSILAKEMFDGNGISEIYRKEHVLIRAIVSMFNTWGEINELYITERSEKNKYLKNILASNEKVRTMLTDVMYNGSHTEIIAALKEKIDTAPEPLAWENADEYWKNLFEMSINRLRYDVRMYDWMSEREKQQRACFRISFYGGHIIFAIPRKWYDKIALDTERAKIAYSLCRDYGFSFYDINQETMYKTYKDCFGNSFWIFQKRTCCTVWIGFDLEHKLRFQIECKTKKYARELLESFEDSTYVDDNEYVIQLPDAEHSSYNNSYKSIVSVVEQVFEKIPELEE